jgi:hypothetical protein
MCCTNGLACADGTGERVKPIRWSLHAEKNLTDRQIDRTEAERTLVEPEQVVVAKPPRQVFMRRYFDRLLQQQMLLRIVVEDTASERLAVTLYKTAQLSKYLKGRAP